jgi:hypothetical protein
MRLAHPRTFRPRNVLIGTIAFTLFVEKVSAQVQPTLPGGVADNIIRQNQTVNEATANLAQWANVGLANGIHAQMRAGNDVVIRSELFNAIAYVALLIASVMFMFRLLQWISKCAESQAIVPISAVQIITPLILSILLANPIGEGFAMQTIVLGTGDLLNSMQSYILTNGANSTQAGGSAVVQAGAKAQIEQSIQSVQTECAATLNQDERKACYSDGYDSVEASLDPFRASQWAKDLSIYAGDALLRNGQDAGPLTNIGGAIGGVIGGAVKSTADKAVNFASGFLSPSIYAGLLLVSSALGVVIEILLMLVGLFFPLSIALSFAPIFEGSWVKWFTGMFQVWLSGLFLRMLVTILAIITIAGSNVSGGLYVVSVALVSCACLIIAIASVVSTVAGIANNVTSNVANLR